MLEANSYYSGGAVWISDSVFALISFVTDEEPIPMGEAVIARLEFSMVSEDDPAVLGAIAIDGVPVTELNREKAGGDVPGLYRRRGDVASVHQQLPLRPELRPLHR